MKLLKLKRRRWTGLAIGDDGAVDVEWDYGNRERKMSAIEQAIAARRKIEEELRHRLVAFSAETGLQVTSVDVSALETTDMKSIYPEFGDYRVLVEVTLRR